MKKTIDKLTPVGARPSEVLKGQLCTSIMQARQKALNAVALGDSNVSLLLSIEGYEFPDMSIKDGDSYDMNWLNIRIVACNGSWIDESEDPCVLTWEIAGIKDEIDRLLRKEIDEIDSDSMFLLTESTIYFTIKREMSGRFKVSLCAKGFNVSTAISNEDLVLIRKQLSLGQRMFPQR